MNTIKSSVGELIIDLAYCMLKNQLLLWLLLFLFFFFSRVEMLVSGLPYKFRNTLFVVRHVESCERIKESSVLTTGL